GLTRILAPAADAPDVASQVFEDVSDRVGGQQRAVERVGHIQVEERVQLLASFIEALLGLQRRAISAGSGVDSRRTSGILARILGRVGSHSFVLASCPPRLEGIIDGLKVDGFDTLLTGFDQADLDSLLQGGKTPADDGETPADEDGEAEDEDLGKGDVILTLGLYRFKVIQEDPALEQAARRVLPAEPAISRPNRTELNYFRERLEESTR
ncbi:MAG: hypothetical protein ACFB21_16760, partial [Opitutales bacterium]